MTRTLVRLVPMLIAISICASVALAQTAVSYTGLWRTQWGAVPGRGGQGSSDINAVHRDGGVIWTYGQGHTMVCVMDGSHCDGTWVGGSGAGWIDVTFTANGRSFTGLWGYGDDHSAAGTFTGTR